MSDKNAEITGRWLSGNLNDAERKAFESSPEGRDFSDILAATEMLKLPEYDAQAALLKLKKSLANAKPSTPQGRIIPFRKWIPIAAAASVVLFVAIYFVVFAESTYSTAFGESTIVTLPDGSRAELHTNTTLTLRKWGFEKNREIQLSGEAYFDVEPGSDFVVHTGTGTVEVLGTTFNVKEYLNELKVECYTGKVQVSDSRNSHILTPGNGVILSPGNPAKLWQHNASGPGWKEGKSVFNNVPLSTVLSELKYLYGIEYTLPEGLDTLRYQGAFPHNDADAAVKLTLDPMNLDYTWNKELSSLVITGFKP
jgi:ferric-dicitrate binding protein FerR (iron transport regulator)